MKNSVRKTLLASAGVLMLASPALRAAEAGDWLFRVGVGAVNPKSNNGDIVSVDTGTTLVFNGTYMFNQNVGLEVLAALPFSHDINLKGTGTKVGETKQLPPTVSLQYHFANDSAFTPYAGLGVNYTLFFDDKARGPLAGSALDLDPSFGLATQVGFDYDLSDNMLVNFDIRWIDIDTDAKLDGAPLETVAIDPFVYSLTVGWKF
ncbi:MAG: outer membrane beta-barrel protein [Gammaproteobacteria bacterium]|nr:outer membrane beta-barrel protein [Gammaproteobacteria bacterium]